MWAWKGKESCGGGKRGNDCEEVGEEWTRGGVVVMMMRRLRRRRTRNDYEETENRKEGNEKKMK